MRQVINYNNKNWPLYVLPDYLCFEAIEAGTIIFVAPNGIHTEWGEANVEYSFDKRTWNTLHINDTYNVAQNQKVYFRGNNPNGFSYGLGSTDSGPSTDRQYYELSFSGRYNVSGNIMTLIDKTGDTLTIPCYWCFYQIFIGSNIVNASELKLPATSLKKNCYRGMFYGCNYMTLAPKELPALTITEFSYSNMFYNCYSLTESPIIKATTITTNGIGGMFYLASSLRKITCYLVSGIIDTNTNLWVYGVSSTGTFIKDLNATWPSGDSGIPEGWTILTSL